MVVKRRLLPLKYWLYNIGPGFTKRLQVKIWLYNQDRCVILNEVFYPLRNLKWLKINYKYIMQQVFLEVFILATRFSISK